MYKKIYFIEILIKIIQYRKQSRLFEEVYE
jgi:hypothetical protein